MENILEIVLAALGVIVSVIFGFPALLEWRKKRKEAKVLQSPNESVLLTKKLKVGCIPFPPFMSYEKRDGLYQFSGIFHEIFKGISSEFDIEIEFIPIQNEESIDLLTNRKIDVVACLFKTFSRGRKMDFSSCIYIVSVGGVIRKSDSRISVQSDLTQEEIKVAVVEGEVGGEIVKETFGVTKASHRLVEVETHEVGSIISMVDNEMVDIAITDNITCKKYLDDHPEMKTKLKHIFIQNPLYLGQVGLMHRTKDSDLTNFLNEKIHFIRKTNAIGKIEDEVIKDYDGMITSIFPHS